MVESSFSDYLHKPISLKALTSKLIKYIQWENVHTDSIVTGGGNIDPIDVEIINQYASDLLKQINKGHSMKLFRQLAELLIEKGKETDNANLLKYGEALLRDIMDFNVEGINLFIDRISIK